MGGDQGPRLSVAAAVSFLTSYSDTSIQLFGKQPEIEQCLSEYTLAVNVSERLSIQHADDVIDMGEKPAKALRQKQASSMWLSLNALAQNQADACVSAGNTGALMALGRHLVKSIEGIDRPAICKPMPTAKQTSFLLDLGANLECSAEQLLQFALMGSALAKVDGRPQPSVALLNVGSEQTKGSEEVQKAAELMRANEHLDFYGFIEGDDLYSGKVDVIVCDGFIGNVALKVSEGLAKFVFKSLQEYVHSSLLRKLVAFLVAPLFRAWSNKFNPSNYNGAILLGLKKIVVKSHGGASVSGFHQALEIAREQVVSNIPSQIESCLR